MTTQWQAILHDGPASPALPVVVSRYAGRLVVRGPRLEDAIAVRRLRRGVRIGTSLTLLRTDREDWQLVVHAVSRDSWLSAVPAPGGGARWLRRVALAVVSGVAVMALCATIWRHALVAAVAPLLPHDVTEPIGRAYVAEIGAACTNPGGVAAMDKLTRRLAATVQLADPLTVTIVDVPGVNAVALPGGHIAVYRGLIEQSASPDELAGELAHEIAHVERQHPNQAMLSEMGPAVLARVLGGDAGKPADLTLLTHGSRAAESEADGGAIATLHRARISSAAVAAFFMRQIAAGSGAAAYDDSHPSDAARAARYQAAILPGTEPSMSDADWQAIKTACSG